METSTLLVTGGTGFVMSVVARRWLDRNAHARCVVLDRSGLDRTAERWFEPVRDRLTLVEADLSDPSSWRAALDGHDITAVVHGATLTPVARGTASEVRRQPEAEDPFGVIDVNLMGTVRMLEWARTRPALRRFIYVSSGSVYRHDGPDWKGEPLPEDGYVAPLTLYGISKFAAEMIVNRYADLFGLPGVSVRLASVYGPMDRVTGSRNVRHAPNRIAHMALDGETIRTNGGEAAGDYVTSTDAAEAILALIGAERLRYRHYNIGSGVPTSPNDFIAWAAERIPSLKAETVAPDEANVAADPARTRGMWGVYDLARIERDTPWRPSDAKTAFHAYMDWIRTVERATREDGR